MTGYLPHLQNDLKMRFGKKNKWTNDYTSQIVTCWPRFNCSVQYFEDLVVTWNYISLAHWLRVCIFYSRENWQINRHFLYFLELEFSILLEQAEWVWAHASLMMPVQILCLVLLSGQVPFCSADGTCSLCDGEVLSPQAKPPQKPTFAAH